MLRSADKLYEDTDLGPAHTAKSWFSEHGVTVPNQILGAKK